MTRLEMRWVDEALVNVQEQNTQQARSVVPGRLNLYRVRGLRLLIESRWPQFLVRLLTLAGFVFTIAAGLFGSRVGSHNFSIIFVWIAWWTALKLAFIPFGGRSWCSVCPIPLPGEWLQQGSILGPGKHKIGLNLRWPKRLKGSCMQSGSFLLIGLFSALTLTDPRVTGWVLLAIFAGAIGLSLVFERRPFCTTFCPIGGFSGMYAKTSPVEVRVIDKDICTRHETKSCYHACPWGVYPVALRDNSACGMCMECLRACPHDNLALNLRPFSTDLSVPPHGILGVQRTVSRLDEAFLALVMLGSVIAFAAVFTGPWGWLKSAAFTIGSKAWMGYAAGFLSLNLLLLPGIFVFMVWAGEGGARKVDALKKAISTQAQGLIPLGLMAWIAFTVSFALPKLNTIFSVMNDPFGWGWRLLGSAGSSLTMNISGISAGIEVVLLLVGLFWSVNVGSRINTRAGKPARRVNFPVLAFSLGFTLVMMGLLIG